MLVLGLSGSLRAGSYNRTLMKAAARSLPATVEVEHYQELGDIPPYNADLDSQPGHPAVCRLRAALRRADAVLIATPEYNASVPGVLKNAIDWASRPFPGSALRDKPVAVIGASTGLFGAVWAQADLRKSLRFAGARVLDDELPVPQAHDAFDAGGNLIDPSLRARLEAIVQHLVSAVDSETDDAAEVARLGAVAG